jgi:AcrR family transcriptional regulator
MSIGLRERKKLKTRAAIQKEALRLFTEKGYEATTIEEIAAAVEISPSTFFNYFPSKEAVVYQDDLDPLIFAAFDAQPADVTPITALRNAMRAVFSKLSAEDRAEMQTRTALVLSSPELRAATLNQFAELVDQFAEMLGHRVGRSSSDFAIRNMAGALLGVLMASYFATAGDPHADLVEIIDRSMAHLEAGLPL